MFERVGVGQADDVASERSVLGFFPDRALWWRWLKDRWQMTPPCRAGQGPKCRSGPNYRLACAWPALRVLRRYCNTDS